MEGKSTDMVIIDDPYATATTMDIETANGITIVQNRSRDERFGNMNRAKRRKIMAMERRAFKRPKK